MQRLYKGPMTITDIVHGTIVLDEMTQELIQTPEMQRLNFIHQLGMSFHVYPCAHGMRFAHVLGVGTTAKKLATHLVLENEDLGLPREERQRLVLTAEAAGLLHDICHTPWSHTLEPLYIRKYKTNHMEVVERLFRGEETMHLPGAGRIPEILQRHGVDPMLVADLINQKCEKYPFLQQMIFGEVDADTLDYLRRDYMYTGVFFGHIDLERLIHTMVVVDGTLHFRSKGLQAVRDFLTARIEMYSAVYLHKKTRIADQMLLRIAERSILELDEFAHFETMTDDEILSGLAQKSADPWVRDLAERLKYRRDLFKRAFYMEAGSMTERDELLIERILQLGPTLMDARDALERELCEESGVEPGYLFVDLPVEAAKVSESRFWELDIRFIDERGRRYTLAEIDRPFADYIRRAKPTRSVFSVYCPEAVRKRVGTAVEVVAERLLQ
jgi:uncharacterized protein